MISEYINHHHMLNLTSQDSHIFYKTFPHMMLWLFPSLYVSTYIYNIGSFLFFTYVYLYAHLYVCVCVFFCYYSYSVLLLLFWVSCLHTFSSLIYFIILNESELIFVCQETYRKKDHLRFFSLIFFIFLLIEIIYRHISFYIF